MPEPARTSLPFAGSIAAALLVVALAGTSANPTDERAAAPALPAITPATEFASMSSSRDVPIADVRAYFERIQRQRAVPRRVAAFFPLYEEAQRVFGVSWRLIASMHRQETAFSASETTYHGRNFAGCCAGPMQFNLTNGPVSTWERYRHSYRAAVRPVSYPHRTKQHPSIYDDFDAIMAAGKLLRDSGGDMALGSSAWSAAYDYYGHDLYGITYANTVTARAQGWRRDGFCVNCLPDEKLMARLDRKFGVHERRLLVGSAAEPETRKERKARERREARRKKAARKRRREAAAERRAEARREEREVTKDEKQARMDKPAKTLRPKPPSPAPTPTAKPPRRPNPQPPPPPVMPAGTPPPSEPAPTAKPNLLEDLLMP